MKRGSVGLASSVTLLCVAMTLSPTQAEIDVTKWLGIAEPLTNLGNYFVGADKLGGKYATAGLLLGAPILSGRYSGGDGFGFKAGGALKDSISDKLGDLFDPLLNVEAFKFDPFAGPKKAGSLIESTIGTAITAGSDVVSSKLQHKLDALSAGLGFATRTGDHIDSAIRTKEKLVRGAIDDVEGILESDPKTAALKSLLFRSLIYHLYMDAGVNAKLSMLKHIKTRLIEYKKLFGPYLFGVDDAVTPILEELEDIYDMFSNLLTLPTNVFYAQTAPDGDATGPEYHTFASVLQQLASEIGTISDYYAGGQRSAVSTIQSWIDGLGSSDAVTAIDGVQAWRYDISSYLDDETKELETALNGALKERNDFLIRFVKGHYLPEIEANGITNYLDELLDKTADAADAALRNYLDLTKTVFSSIEGLVRDDVFDPKAYLDALNLLANGGTTAEFVYAATTVWQLYTRAFELQLDLAQSLGAKLPELPDTVGSVFKRLLEAFGNVPGYFQR